MKTVSDTARTAAFGIAIAALTIGCTEPPPAAPPPPPEVLVADVIQRDVPVYLELVGQTLGFQDVEIRARVEGYLTNMSFQEGSLVRKGDLLYEIDRLPLAGDRGPGQGRPGNRGSTPRQGQQRRRALSTAGRQTGRQPARARRRGRGAGCRQVAGGRRQGQRRQGDARSELHPHHRSRSAASSARRWSRPATSSAAARARC